MPDDGYQKRRRRVDDLAEPKQADHQCAYVAGSGVRCRELGTLSSSTTGGGPYYCRTHWSERGSSLADQTAEFSYRYTPKPRRPWQDELRAQRVTDLNLPERMSRDDAVSRLAGTVFGKVLLRNLGRLPPERTWTDEEF